MSDLIELGTFSPRACKPTHRQRPRTTAFFNSLRGNEAVVRGMNRVNERKTAKNIGLTRLR